MGQERGTLRWMIKRDLDEVCAIERLCYRHPWTKKDFLQRLKARNCVGMVWEDDIEEVHGFVIYELGAGVLEITNIAVRYAMQGTGIGRALVSRLTDKLTPDRLKGIEVKVRERNLDAQLFFRALGFRAIRVLRGYFEADGKEDAYLFHYAVAVPQKTLRTGEGL